MTRMTRLQQLLKIRKIFSTRHSDTILTELLNQSTQNMPFAEKAYWFGQVLLWLFAGGAKPGEARWRLFFNVLDKNPGWRENLRQTLNSLLIKSDFLPFFMNVGLAVEYGLWGDIANRLKEKVLPVGPTEDFQEIFLLVCRNQSDVEALRGISDATLLRIQELVMDNDGPSFWPTVVRQMSQALGFLAIHVAHYGISAEMRSRLPQESTTSELSFFRLANAVNRSEIIQPTTVGDAHLEAQLSATLALALDHCDADVEAIYLNMEAFGVSVDIVNRLETVSAMLARMRSLRRLLSASSGMEKTLETRSFLIAAAEAGIQGRSVVNHLRRHFYLLSRKIVERNGQSGDHYIARTRKDFWSLFRSAIAGGWIVVVMTIVKSWLLQSNPAPLFLAMGVWIIYSAGFLSMQFTGCTLATKIPSFTASRLAEILKNTRKESLHGLRTEFQLIVKSQLVALLGNIFGVIPFALVLVFASRSLLNAYVFMSDGYAKHVLEGLNPFVTAAVPLGMLTGVLLWLSSIAGGWFENWVVFNGLPTSIEHGIHFKKILGASSAKKLADFTLNHSSGIATNVSLAFLFGFAPLFGALLGLNWNANHVTISTASAVFAVATFDFDLTHTEWVLDSLGLVLIAVMNFGISFGLALYIAGNAQKIKMRRLALYLTLGARQKK